MCSKLFPIKRYFLITILLLTISSGINAKERTIIGYVYDASSKEVVDDVTATLLRSDSTIIATVTTVGKKKDADYLSSSIQFHTSELGKFIIRFEAFGYITTYKDIEIKDSKRNGVIDFGFIAMKKDKHILKELTVTATKIKMLVRGDTVVYNADAFQLAEGSMLEALIKQLPGAKLEKDGRITMNGKFIESLFVNGKEFFQGDPKIALENLPTYMVNKIKVYNKKNNLSNAPQLKKDDHLILDVLLKKQYSTGWIANAGGGIGSNNRYTARLFGLRFSNKSRLSIIGNLNNVNDRREPGENADNWSPSDATSGGRESVKTGGLSYHTESKTGSTSFHTENIIERQDGDNRSTSASETFLSSGNVFSRSKSVSKLRNSSYKTSNEFIYMKKSCFFNTNINANYSRNDGNNRDISGTFSSDPSIYKNILDSLYSSTSEEKMKLITSNRRKQEGLNRSHTLSASFGSSLHLTTDKQTHDGLSLNGSISYNNTKNRTFSQSNLDYPSNSTMSADNRNQYTIIPQKGYECNLSTRYEYFLRNDLGIGRKGKSIVLTPHYDFQQSYNSSANSLYRLDGLNKWENNNFHQLGTLPSTLDSLQMSIDARNSYLSSTHNTLHKVGISMNFVFFAKTDSISAEPNGLSLSFDLPLSFKRQSMSYYRNNSHYPAVRHDTFFDPNISINWTNEKIGFFSLNYNYSSSSPQLTSLIDIRDDSDPLNISLGNPDLKCQHTHNVILAYNNFHQKHSENLMATINYNTIQNAMAMGFVYDKTTGTRTTKPENVNGNWNLSSSINYTRTIDKKDRLTLETNTSANYNTSVDLASSSDALTSSRSKVNNLALSETMSLAYRPNSDFMFSGKFGGNFTHTTSQRDNFATINAGDFNYGLSGQVKLPWDMQISTDITMYSRRGYADHQMNTNELVWNGRLSKTLLHGRLTCMLDGFDILSKLSNVQRTLNEQGRTEVYNNVIPSYAMFHFIYRLNLSAKKS